MQENEDGFEFEKFMDGILNEEAKKKTRTESDAVDTPARVYIKRYRELPQNRIVYRSTK